MKNEKRGFFARWWWLFLLIGIAVGPIVGFVGAALITRAMPKQYESTAIVQVTPLQIVPVGGELAARSNLETQFEIIQEDETLAMVIEELDLEKRWGMNRKESIEALRQTVRVNQRTGTDLIEIKVRSVEAVLAGKMAESLASSYQIRRNAEERARAEVELKRLDAEIEEQKKRVEEKRKALDKIVRITGRPYFEREQNEQPLADEDAVEAIEYRETTEEYESALELLQEAKLQHSTERVGLRSPREPITIHEDPRVGERPVSPNGSKNLVAGVVVGAVGGVVGSVLVGFLLGFWIAGRKNGVRTT